MVALATLLGVLLGSSMPVWASAPDGPWDKFNYAPATRVVRPTSIQKSVGSVKSAQNLLKPTGSATLSTNDSWLTLDFGKEVRYASLISLLLV